MTRSHATWIAILLVLPACGGGVDRESFPREAAETFCAIVDECAPIFRDPDCVSELAPIVANGSEARLQVLIDRGTVRYDGGAARRCLDATRALGCDLLIAGQLEECLDVYVGTVAIGGRCTVDEECAGAAFCDSAQCPESAGTCTALRAAGAECFGTEECAVGLACEGGTCRAPASRSGGSCGGDSNLGCPLDELCVGATETEAGTCRALTDLQSAGLGQPCAIDDYSVLCEPGLVCALINQVELTATAECRAPAALGGACFFAAPDMCPTGSYCDADLGANRFEGTCRSLPSVGEPCAEATAADACGSGLVCIEGTCRLLLANGESCTDPNECYSGVCEGTCVPLSVCP